MARAFNGTTDYIQLANESNFDVDFGSTFSVALWLYANTFSGFSCYPIAKFDSGNGVGWRFSANDSVGGLAASMLTNATANGIEKHYNTALQRAYWYHLGFTYSGNSLASGLTMYMNGSAAATTTDQDNVSGSILNNFPVTLGASTNGGVSPLLNGNLSGIGIWSSVLSSGNMSSLAAGADPVGISNSSLIAYLPLCGVASPEPDQKGTNNGTVTGTIRAGDPPFPLWCQAQDAPVIAGRGAM